MRVFISWSGERSRQLALQLKEWIPHVIQTAEPWVSEDDIGKGEPWYTVIGETLESSAMGIIIVTPENQHEPWVNFEAGALSRLMGSTRACPLVLGMTKAQLIAPLGGLNATDATMKQDMRRLMLSIRPEEIPERAVSYSFERAWDEIAPEILRLAAELPPIAPAPRSEADMLAEILDLLRHEKPQPRVIMADHVTPVIDQGLIRRRVSERLIAIAGRQVPFGVRREHDLFVLHIVRSDWQPEQLAEVETQMHDLARELGYVGVVLDEFPADDTLQAARSFVAFNVLTGRKTLDLTAPNPAATDPTEPTRR